MSLADRMLAQVMANSRGAASLPPPTKEDPRAKENRSAMRKLLEKAAETNNLEEIKSLQNSANALGVDPIPYMKVAGIKTPQEKMQDHLQKVFQSLSQGGQQRAAPMGDIPVDEPTSMQPSAAQPQQVKSPQEYMTEDWLKSAAIKQVLGITVSPDEFADERWWSDYRSAMQANPEQMQDDLVDQLTAKHGHMPADAVHLRDISPEKRNQIAMQNFQKRFNDPMADALVKSIYPKGNDPVKTGLVLSTMIKDGIPIPKELNEFYTEFIGLRDDIQAMKASDITNEVKARGFAEEDVAEQTFKGKLGREEALAKMKREVNKPYMTDKALDKILAGKNFLDIATRTMQTVAAYTGRGKELDIDRLPVGIGEAYRKYMDKYGVGADANRIKLRTSVSKFIELAYEIRGLQMSDKEIALAAELQSAMNEESLQFITKFSQFQKALQEGTMNTIEVNKKAGKDVAGLEEFAQELAQMPTLDNYLGMQQAQPKLPIPQSAYDYLKANPNKGVKIKGVEWRLTKDGQLRKLKGNEK